MSDPRIEQAAEQYRDERDSVSPVVAQRLAAARRSAVAVLDEKQPRFSAPVAWVGAGAMTAGIALSAVLYLNQADAPATTTADRGIEILAADPEELNLISELDVLEELEFLAWLEQESTDGQKRG